VTFVYLLVGLLLLLGLAGSVLPFLPGPPLIIAAALIYALATDFHPVGLLELLILAGLALVAYGVDYLASAVGAKKLGASAWGVVGAILGAVVGAFFGPAGLLLGPLVGAVAGELLRGRDFSESLRGGLGAVIGALGGAVVKLGLAVVMVALFLFWAWPR
jgi:uncharacterized protein YqgC (DUF456 family)